MMIDDQHIFMVLLFLSVTIIFVVKDAVILSLSPAASLLSVTIIFVVKYMDIFFLSRALSLSLSLLYVFQVRPHDASMCDRIDPLQLHEEIRGSSSVDLPNTCLTQRRLQQNIYLNHVDVH